MIYTNLNNSGEVEAIYAAKRATITGAPPLLYPSKGYDLEDFLISGNTIQNGTPTPTSPIYPQECGDRTANIAPVTSYSGWATDIMDRFNTDYGNISYDSGQYTFSANITTSASVGIFKFCFTYTDDTTSKSGWISATSRRATLVSTYGKTVKSISITDYNNFVSLQITNIMLNAGSTVLPYEPYGYKLPIVVNDTESPIYLGQVEVTRRIKKLVLKGNETFYKNSNSSTNYLYYAHTGDIFQNPISKTPLFCNELSVETDPPILAIGINTNNTFGVVYFNFGAEIMNAQPSRNTVAGLKEYLTAQYAAGTPVTVWYVLAKPETAVVNEPLHKIGNYADTISLSQSGITVPTVAGANIITTETTILPSSISVTTPEKEVAEVYAGINYQDPIYYKSRTLTGTTPLDYKALGKPLSDYLIKGNTFQNGVPAPSAPVGVAGVGELTRNLFEIVPEILDANNWTVSPIYSGNRYFQYFQLPDELKGIGTCYCKVHPNYSQGYTPELLVIGLTPGVLETVDTGYRILTNQGVSYDRTFDFSNWDHVYLCIGYGLGYNTGGQADIQKQQVKIDEFFTNYNMTISLNSFMSSYEPYGYKLPITVNSTEYPIYFGEVETVRRIKKLVLKGDDTETYTSTYSGDKCFFNYVLDSRGLNILISTHFIAADISSTSTVVGIRIVSDINLCIRPENVSDMTVDTFKAWLQQQYTAGTPVTIWYVLAEPETGIVNESLNKIGDYIDTISMAQAGLTIPTVAGANTLTVGTTIHPSEMSITGNIKPTGYGQLLDVNNVDIQDKNNVPIFIHS